MIWQFVLQPASRLGMIMAFEMTAKMVLRQLIQHTVPKMGISPARLKHLGLHLKSRMI